MLLPESFVQDLPGGTLRLRRWDEAKRQASFHVTDRQGQPVGIVRFAPTVFLCMPTRCAVTTATAVRARDLRPDFWGPAAPEAATVGASDLVYFFTVPAGMRHYVVAGGLRYDRATP